MRQFLLKFFKFSVFNVFAQKKNKLKINNMKTVLKIITKEGNEYFDIANIYNMTPRKDDHFVYNEESYIVSWVEFDFDRDTLYIISIN